MAAIDKSGSDRDERSWGGLGAILGGLGAVLGDLARSWKNERS